MYRLSDGLRKFSKALHVSMSYEDPDLMKKGAALKELAERWPGGVKVVVDLERADGTKVEIDRGVRGVDLSAEFLLALNRLQKTAPYHLETVREIFLQEEEKRPWERR